MRPLLRTWRLPAVGVALTVLAGCDLPGFGAPDPASEEGESIFTLWRGFFVAAVGVGLLVWGLLIFVLIRYRRRNDEVPNQSGYNIPLEIVYTALPVVAVAVLFGFSVATENEVTALDKDPDVTIEVIGFQWSWTFRYEDEDITITGTPSDPPEMVLPVDQVTHLRLVANDVAHSFWVPDFLSKRDLIPDVHNEIQVTPNKTGGYEGRCAEFCGIDHWRMNYTVRVVSADEFDAWVDEQQSAPADTTDTTAAA